MVDSTSTVQSKNLFNEPVVVPSTTETADYLDPAKSQQSQHLNVPDSTRLRRASLDSAFSGSDLSELSFGALGGAPHTRIDRVFNNASPELKHAPGQPKWRTWLQEFWVINYGAFLVLCSQLFGVSMTICTRMLETPGAHGEPMHPYQILFVRQSITASACTGYALWTKSIPHFPLGPPGSIRWLLVIRGFCGFVGVFGFYYSLIYLPIAEATVLTYMTPIVVCYICAMLIPGETFTGKQQIASFVSFIGVIFIAQPLSFLHASQDDAASFPASNGTATSTAAGYTQGQLPRPTPSQRLQAVGIAMCGVVGSVGALTAIRMIGTRVHAFISVNYFSVWCTIVSLIALLVVPSVSFRLPGNLMEWTLLGIIGACGFVMQGLLTMGLAYGGPSSRSLTAEENSADLEMQARQADTELATTMASSAATNSNMPHGGRNKDRSAHHQSSMKSSVKGSGTRATSMMYTSMLFSLAADKVIFAITPGLWSWVGSGFILTGALWVAAQTQTMSTDKAETSHLRTERPEREEQVGLLADTEDDRGEASNAESEPESVARGERFG